MNTICEIKPTVLQVRGDAAKIEALRAYFAAVNMPATIAAEAVNGLWAVTVKVTCQIDRIEMTITKQFKLELA